MSAKQHAICLISFHEMKLYYSVDFVVYRAALPSCCGRIFTLLGGLLPSHTI
jgi:hypothetical protein